MTITAKNYAAQCERDLINLSTYYKKNNIHKRDEISLNCFIDSIRKSVHFSMPDNGVIFDDRLHGIENNLIRLPFESITLEYFVSDHVLNDIAQVRSSKRLLLANEISIIDALMLGYINNETIENSNAIKNSEFLIMINVCSFNDEINKYVPSHLGVFIPNKWDDISDNAKIAGFTHNVTKKNPRKFPSIPFVAFSDQYKDVVNMVGEELAMSYGINDIMPEVCALFEFIEALSCTNVEQTIHQEASQKNAQRIKSHKLPIYETKVLTIKASEKSTPSVKIGYTGTHASPRQHLRRGHIRRLETGNIWVNACVVGDKDKGVIKKSYNVV